MSPPTEPAGAPHGSGHGEIAQSHSPETGPHGHAPSGQVTPLWAVLGFTFFNSYATGTMFNGIFFVLKSSYNFSPLTSCLLGLAFGVTYVAGAMGAGPIMRRWQAAGFSSRQFVALLMVLGAALNLMPVAAWYLSAPESRQDLAWVMWVFSSIYSALCGMLWPVVESFLSGGRAARELRTATGKFNVTWSSALVGSLLVLSLFSQQHKIASFGLVAAVHLATLAILLWWPRNPAPHPHTEAGQTPPVYAELLSVHRVLLPLTYLVMYALGPLQPDIMSRIGIAQENHELVGATWLAARVIAFFSLGVWHSWHGKYGAPIVGMSLLLCGFGLCVLCPLLTGTGWPGWLPIAAFLLGLTSFGLGAATIYTGALYYAMEVGSAEVDAGGTHEAVIGLGYTIGPICSLVPLVGVHAGAVGEGAANPMTLGITTSIVAVGLVVAARVRASSRATTKSAQSLSK